MRNKIVAILVLAGLLLSFGCIGGGQQATGAADGDFRSLNIRGGPAIFSGSENHTGNETHSGVVTFSGTVTIPVPVNVSASATYAGNNNYTGNDTFTGTNTHSGTETFSGTVNQNGNVNSTGNNSYSGINTHTGTEAYTGTVNLTSATVSAANVVEAGSGTFVNNTNGAVFTFSTAFLSTPKVVVTAAGAASPLNVSFYVGAANATTVTVNSTQAPEGGNVTINYVAVGAQ